MITSHYIEQTGSGKNSMLGKSISQTPTFTDFSFDLIYIRALSCDKLVQCSREEKILPSPRYMNFELVLTQGLLWKVFDMSSNDTFDCHTMESCYHCGQVGSNTKIVWWKGTYIFISQKGKCLSFNMLKRTMQLFHMVPYLIVQS